MKTIQLRIWDEFVGKLTTIHKDSDSIKLKLGDKVVRLLKESDEADYIDKRIGGHLIGRRIAILRTDIHDKPLLIRIVE